MGTLKNILIGSSVAVVTAGAGFVGGAVYKDKTIDVTQTDEYKTVLDENTELNNQLDENKIALASALNSKTQLTEQVTELNSNITTLNNELTLKTETITTLQNDVNNKNEQIESLQADITTITTQVNELQADVSEKQSQIAELQADAEANATQIAELQADVQTKSENIVALNNELSVKSETITTLQDDVQIKSETITTLTNEAETLTQEIDNLQNQLDAKNQEIESLNYKINTLTQSIVSVETDLSKIDGITYTDICNIKTVDNKLLIPSVNGLYEYNILTNECICLSEEISSAFGYVNLINIANKYYISYKINASQAYISEYDSATGTLHKIDFAFSNIPVFIYSSDNIAYFNVSLSTIGYIYALDSNANSISLIGSNTAIYLSSTSDYMGVGSTLFVRGSSGTYPGLYCITPTGVTKLLSHYYFSFAGILDNKLIISAKEGIYAYDINSKQLNTLLSYDTAYSEAPTMTYLGNNKFLRITKASADGTTGAIYDVDNNDFQEIEVTSNFVKSTKFYEDDNYIYFYYYYNGALLYTFNKYDYSISEFKINSVGSSTYSAFNYKDKIILAQMSTNNSYTDTNLYIFDINTQIISTISNGLVNGTKGLFTKSYEVDNQLIISLFVNSKHNVDYKVDFDNQKLVPVKTEISF